MKYRHNIIKLICLTALLTAAGCQSEMLVDYQEQTQTQNSGKAIDFVGGFIDNMFRTRATTMLSQHSATMGVWGWQTTLEDGEVKLFDNQNVYYSDELQDWTYSPKKYWASDSEYRFYAYAPHSTSVEDAVVSIDPESGKFSIEGVTLEGSNLQQENPSAKTSGIFADVTDVDWMIDRVGLTELKGGTSGNRVTFNMQHILAKLNVLVRLNSALADDERITVTLDSLKIGSFIGNGTFVQKYDRTPDPTDADNYPEQEWTSDLTKPAYLISSAEDVEIDGKGVYVIESLVIPQQTSSDSKIRVYYTISTTDGHAERYYEVFSLDEAFTGFATGHNYTLTLTIAPDYITFDAGSDSWDENNVSAGNTIE